MTSADSPSHSRHLESQKGFAVLVATGIFLSRITGLVREKVFAHYLGNSDAAGVFKAALRIPNFLQNMLGEGTLSASFIPVYARLVAEGEEELAGRVAGIIATLLALATTVLVILGVIFTPWLLLIIAPGFKGEVRELTIEVVRILFPGIGLLVLYAWCLGILNSHRKFLLVYVAPVLMNFAVIAALLVFGGRLSDAALARMVGWGTVAGAVLQLGLVLPSAIRHARHLRLAFDTALAPVREILRNFVPAVVGRGVVQISAYIDELLATLLGTAAVASLAYAQTIYLLPISLFGMSVAAAELPEMSRATGTEREVADALRKRIERSVRRIAFFVVPCVVGFFLIGDVLVAALYQSGRFTAHDTRYVWYILAAYTIGLLAATLGRVYSSAFYALRDTKSPLRFAVVRVLMAAGLGYLFAIPLRPYFVGFLETIRLPLPAVANAPRSFGAIALALASAIAGLLEYWLLRRTLSHRIGWIDPASGNLLRLAVAAIAAGGGAAAFARRALPTIHDALPAVLPHVRDAVLTLAVFGTIYAAATLALGIAEARATLDRFRRRRG